MTDVLPREVQWRPGKQDLSPNFQLGLLGRDRALVDSAVLGGASAVRRIADVTALRRAYRRSVTRALGTLGPSSDEAALYRAAVLDGWLAKEAMENPHRQTLARTASRHA
jgi:asparagine synthase (glutamine-hydrolysing)